MVVNNKYLEYLIYKEKWFILVDTFRDSSPCLVGLVALQAVERPLKNIVSHHGSSV
jgi:hypothetical protein